MSNFVNRSLQCRLLPKFNAENHLNVAACMLHSPENCSNVDDTLLALERPWYKFLFKQLGVVTKFVYTQSYHWSHEVPYGSTYRQRACCYEPCVFIRCVSCTGNRHPIPGNRAPAATMIGRHGTARHWAAGDGACRMQAPAPAAKWQLKMASTFKRLVIWRSVFIFFGTRSLVKG